MILKQTFHTKTYARQFSSSCTRQLLKDNEFIPTPSGKRQIELSSLDSMKMWFKSLGNSRLELLQRRLVDFMLPDSPTNSNIKKEFKKVDIGNGQYINEVCLSVTHGGFKPTKDIVFIHGFGASLGCFARNFNLVSRLNESRGKYNYKIHFLDNISFGLSSNPKLDVPLIEIPKLKLNDSSPGKKENIHDKYYKLIDSYEVDLAKFSSYQKESFPLIEKIENYYTDAIEKWRSATNLSKFVLVGHSYGGYLSSTYSVKYHQHIDRLILLSPAGIERHAMAITNPITKDFKGEKKVTVKPSLDPSTFEFLSRLPILSERFQKLWFLQVFLSKLYKFSGPLGAAYYYKLWAARLFRVQSITKNYPDKLTIHDKPFGSEKEVALLIEYLYNVARRENMSDFLIRDLLTPSTVAKFPVFDKFEKLLNDNLNNKDFTMFKVDFLYGKFDYMYYRGGQLLSERLNQWKGGNDRLSGFHRVSDAGHNLYLDNPYETNELLIKLIEEEV